MRVRNIGLAFVLIAALAAASPALAGAKIKINDKAEIDLGFRLQALYLMEEADINADGSLESIEDFKVRRARLRVKATIGEHVEMFIQTESGGAANSGLDMRMIDAFITVKANPWAQFIAGLNMAPASRQNTTSSGALMAIDRPGQAYKSLTWGTRVLRSFSTRTIAQSTGNFATPVAVRDTGLTLFGSGSFGDNFHLKYYVGAYDGNNAPGRDTFRTTARVQINIWDAEGGYYNSSTYLAKKRTLAFGASYDTQSDAGRIGIGSEPAVVVADYTYTSVDGFLELPFGDKMALTAEAAFSTLDFDDNPSLLNSQGDGYYVQAGFYCHKWQPFVEYESWTSDRTDDVGNVEILRAGINYYLEGQNANFKLGYEDYSADVAGSVSPLAPDTSATAVVFGFYVTY